MGRQRIARDCVRIAPELRRIAHLLDGGHHLRRVGDLGVDAGVGARHHVVAVHEVGDVLHLDDVVPLQRKVLRQQRLRQLVEPRAVGVVDEAIAVHAHVLVDPEPHQVGRLVRHALVRAQHPLHHRCDVAQVESVVRLRRRRQHLLPQLVVQVDRRVDHRVDAREHALGQVRLDKRLEHELVDRLDGHVLELGEREEVEVAEEAVGHRLAAAARRPHRADEGDVDDLSELHRLAVVPAAVAHPKP